MASSEKVKGKEVQKEKEEEGEAQKQEMVDKVQREDRKLHYGEEDRGWERKGMQEERGRPKARQTWEKAGRWLFLLLLLGQKLALCQCCGGIIAEKGRR